MSKFELKVTHVKILQTVQELNDKKMYSTAYGIYKLVNGVIDEDTKELQDISTFASLISFNSKKVSNLVMMLIRYKYLRKIFDSNTNELYLQITDLGVKSLLDYQKHHKMNYKCKKKKFVNQIVKLEK